MSNYLMVDSELKSDISNGGEYTEPIPDLKAAHGPHLEPTQKTTSSQLDTKTSDQSLSKKYQKKDISELPLPNLDEHYAPTILDRVITFISKLAKKLEKLLSAKPEILPEIEPKEELATKAKKKKRKEEEEGTLPQ